MWSELQKLYINDTYFGFLVDFVDGMDLDVYEYIIEDLEDTDEYEACEGIKRAYERCKTASLDEIIEELINTNQYEI